MGPKDVFCSEKERKKIRNGFDEEKGFFFCSFFFGLDVAVFFLVGCD